MWKSASKVLGFVLQAMLFLGFSPGFHVMFYFPFQLILQYRGIIELELNSLTQNPILYTNIVT